MQSSSSSLKSKQEPTITSSYRQDGSKRKDIKIKPGYISKEEAQKYIPPSKRVKF